MNRQQQVVFIIHCMYRAGTQSVLHQVVSHLDRRLFERHVVSFVKSDDAFKFDPDVTFHYLLPQVRDFTTNGLFRSLRKKLYTIRIIFRLARLLASFSEDVILVPFLRLPTIYTVLSTFHSKRHIISSLHVTDSIRIRNDFRFIPRRMLEERLFKAACSRSNEIIVPSEGVKTDLHQHYSIPTDKIRVIPNPIDLTTVDNMRCQTIDIPYRWEPGITVYIHVGRLAEEKNHRLLIKASALLKRRGHRFVLFCAGSGPEESKIGHWIHEYGLEGHVLMLGELDNPYALMSIARSLILTSHHEVSPMVILEAMASGTTVISVDCPSYGPREILDQGKYGLLVTPNDPYALAKAMVSIAQDDTLFNDLKRKGGNRVAQYDVPMIAKSWENLLSDRMPLH